MTLRTTVVSPLGDLLLVGTQTGDGISLRSLSVAPSAGRGGRPGTFAPIVGQLEAYFAGDLTWFDIRFTRSGTDFQERVWATLEEIPYGATTTYGRIAARLGLARDRIQAVGAAIGANPLLLVRPCHRVIGADGSMRGYAAGVERKVQLLTHEGALQPALL